MPLITLTSDFGIQNHVVSAVKGRILSALPQSNLIDISHTLSEFNLQQAVYVFKSAIRFFPAETFHFVFCDLYASKSKQLLYVYENGQHIFCPDNGFLTLLFDEQPLRIFSLSDALPAYDFIHICDAYTQVVLQLIEQQVLALAPLDVNDMVVKKPTYAILNQNTLEAQVLYIDSFGNVVLNLTRTQFEKARMGRKFRILFMHDEEINSLSEYYHDVAAGDNLCLFNSADYLEIAVNRGSAAQLFGFSTQGEKSVFYQTIKLFFE
ncbi:MAG: hypothetical protein RIQ62_1325 [Bacteroidota bacterium]